jgi:amidophosphoribosyltransferase
MGALKEACGLFGLYSAASMDISLACHLGLYALQHRGQEGCGIAWNERGVLSLEKDLGLVAEVFPQPPEVSPSTRMAIAHTRYGTSGERSRENVQPLLIRHQMGSMALAHNGNLTNDQVLRSDLEKQGSLFHTTSDTEVIAYIITKHRLGSSNVEEAIEKAMDELKGSYSLLVMTAGKLIAVRDPYGFKPLCIGKLEDGYVFASESCALDAVGARFPQGCGARGDLHR